METTENKMENKAEKDNNLDWLTEIVKFNLNMCGKAKYYDDEGKERPATEEEMNDLIKANNFVWLYTHKEELQKSGVVG